MIDNRDKQNYELEIASTLKKLNHEETHRLELIERLVKVSENIEYLEGQLKGFSNYE